VLLIPCRASGPCTPKGSQGDRLSVCCACLGECLRDLLDLSARLLRVGGRLVYFMPAAPEAYDDSEVPQHPALSLVANTEQVLNSRYSRRLITMRKARTRRCPMLPFINPRLGLWLSLPRTKSQVLNSRYSRRLITMRKARAPRTALHLFPLMLDRVPVSCCLAVHS
jgi:hypothetical protein